MRGNTLNPSEAAAALGSIRTPKKTASSRINAAKASEARKRDRKPLASVSCTCGAGQVLDKSAHGGNCKLYQAIYYRERKGLPIV